MEHASRTHQTSAHWLSDLFFSRVLAKPVWPAPSLAKPSLAKILESGGEGGGVRGRGRFRLRGGVWGGTPTTLPLSSPPPPPFPSPSLPRVPWEDPAPAVVLPLGQCQCCVRRVTPSHKHGSCPLFRLTNPMKPSCTEPITTPQTMAVELTQKEAHEREKWGHRRSSASRPPNRDRGSCTTQRGPVQCKLQNLHWTVKWSTFQVGSEAVLEGERRRS